MERERLGVLLDEPLLVCPLDRAPDAPGRARARGTLAGLITGLPAGPCPAWRPPVSNRPSPCEDGGSARLTVGADPPRPDPPLEVVVP
ncbi:hypothetical protein ACWGIU_02035 [Streptomyces sp. NPDC054840]